MLEKRTTTTGKIYANIEALKTWDKNPKQEQLPEDFERLKRQIAFLGQYKPLIVTQDGIVVGGNQRLKSMAFLNDNIFKYEDKSGKHEIDLRGQFKEIWITELSFGKVEKPAGQENLPDTFRAIVDGKVQEREYSSIEQIMIEYAVSDNDGNTGYDEQKLVELVSPYKELIPMNSYKLELSPSTSLETFINEFKGDKQTENKGVEDEPPAVDEKNPPVSKFGEVYQLGQHRLICGDSTKRETYERLLGDIKVDMIFTDPPYNVSYEGKTKEALTIQNDKQTTDNFYQFLYDAFKNMNEFSKSGASIYVCHADTERVNFTKAFQDAGWKLAQIIIWAKTHFVMGRQDYQWQHEPILYGWKEGESHYYNGGRTQSTLWHMDRPTKATEHPTMKPIQLVVRSLTNSSKGDDVILDPFGGSGSTLIACEQIGRTCYTAEFDPKYCDVIRKRYAKFVGQKDKWEEATPILQAAIAPLSVEVKTEQTETTIPTSE